MELLIDAVPEEWPEGGWNILLGENFAPELPVAGFMYDKLMASEPDKWEDHLYKADGRLPHSITWILMDVRSYVC